MHVVDVNSGRAGRGLSQEESSLRVNIEAAKIICKQVRLRGPWRHYRRRFH